MTVTLLGTASVQPGPDHDTASLLVDGRVLIDTGWSAALRMDRFGLDPAGIEALLLTHAHHDHYLGLPQLLFWRSRVRPALGPLPIYGPAEDTAPLVARAADFLQAERYPEFRADSLAQVVPLTAGKGFAVGGLGVMPFDVLHTVPALGYRLHTERATVAFTGDTAAFPSLARDVAGADLLITEASYGAAVAPAEDPWRHQGAAEAARLALDSGARRLALVHCREEEQGAAVALARSIFPETFWPADGETVEVG